MSRSFKSSDSKMWYTYFYFCLIRKQLWKPPFHRVTEALVEAILPTLDLTLIGYSRLSFENNIQDEMTEFPEWSLTPQK